MDPLSFLFKVATHTAGSRLREIQQDKERAEAKRLAVREKARQEQIAAQEKACEDRDPVYRTAKNAERAQAAAQRVRDAVRRKADGHCLRPRAEAACGAAVDVLAVVCELRFQPLLLFFYPQCRLGSGRGSVFVCLAEFWPALAGFIFCS